MLGLMELRHLRLFVTLAEELHFGRTAKRLHVAQSAVSQTVKDLEEELATRLFERTSRQVTLTTAGVEFERFAREALQVVERGVRAARSATDGTSRLTLRFISVATSTALVPALGRFAKAHPEVTLDLQDGGSARNLEALEAGLCDFAFVSVASAKKLAAPFESAVIQSSELGVLMAKGHRLSTRRTVRLRELAGERVLSLHRADEPDVRARLDTRLATLGGAPSTVEVSQSEGLLALVAANLGVAVAPVFLAQSRPREVVAVPLAEHVRVGIAAVWNTQRLTVVAREFLVLLGLSEPRPASRPRRG